jgi:hypothetical protein
MQRPLPQGDLELRGHLVVALADAVPTLPSPNAPASVGWLNARDGLSSGRRGQVDNHLVERGAGIEMGGASAMCIVLILLGRCRGLLAAALGRCPPHLQVVTPAEPFEVLGEEILDPLQVILVGSFCA